MIKKENRSASAKGAKLPLLQLQRRVRGPGLLKASLLLFITLLGWTKQEKTQKIEKDKNIRNDNSLPSEIDFSDIFEAPAPKPGELEYKTALEGSQRTQDLQTMLACIDAIKLRSERVARFWERFDPDSNFVDSDFTTLVSQNQSVVICSKISSPKFLLGEGDCLRSFLEAYSTTVKLSPKIGSLLSTVLLLRRGWVFLHTGQVDRLVNDLSDENRHGETYFLMIASKSADVRDEVQGLIKKLKSDFSGNCLKNESWVSKKNGCYQLVQKRLGFEGLEKFLEIDYEKLNFGFEDLMKLLESYRSLTSLSELLSMNFWEEVYETCN